MDEATAMMTWPDAPAVNAFVQRAGRRIGWIAATYGAAAGLLLALLVSRSPFVAAGLAAAISLGSALLARRGSRDVAQRIERRTPACRNVVITATELMDAPARVPHYIGEVVCRDAARVVGTLKASELFPMRRALSALVASVAAWVLLFAFAAANPPMVGGSTAPVVASAVIRAIDVTITPPAYTGQGARTVRDPVRIVALEGSRITVRVNAEAATVTLETLRGRSALTRDANAFGGEIAADADGFIAIEPAAPDGRVGARRLIGLSVLADNAPRVRITTPGRDQLLPDARRTIDVAITADDDLSLASLRLRYTKVSGSGEQFTFVDGELPLTVTRQDPRTWSARGALRLDSLRLVAGDMLVYRGVATDHRPGGMPGESDAFIVEISAPGAIAGGGFAIDDQEDRYGISQQMVILFTERLIAQRGSLSAEAFADEARRIAAAQRQVRAEFVFMLGGELAEDVLEAAGTLDVNEEAHAAADDDAIGGRLANQGRLDLLRAIRSMSSAASALAASDLPSALTAERAALASLQRAFTRTRYILRTLTARERIDFTRRLTGTLTGIARDVGPAIEGEPEARVTALRSALAEVATVAGTEELGAPDAARISSVAERVLRVNPSDTSLQSVSRTLADAATLIGRAQAAQARTSLDSAATLLSAFVRSALIGVPVRALPFAARMLDGALVDALRDPRGSR